MKAVLVASAAAAALLLSADTASAGRPFWEDPAFEADLGLPAAGLPSAGGGGVGGGSPLRREAGRMRFREARPDAATGEEDQPRFARRRSLGGAPSLADRLGLGGRLHHGRLGGLGGGGGGGGDEGMFKDVPAGLEPPMNYGDSGAFYRFRQQAESVADFRHEAVHEGPFGGVSKIAPVEHRVAGGGRFEAPAFAEVVTQLKEIISNPHGNANPPAARHMLSSIVSAPGRAPPMAPAPPGGGSAGPPIPLPSPILTPIDREAGKPATPAEQPAAAAAAAPHRDAHAAGKPRFLLETAAEAHLAAPRPRSESLVETAAALAQRESPEDIVRRLATGQDNHEEPVSMPAFRPVPVNEHVIGNPYVRYD